MSTCVYLYSKYSVSVFEAGWNGVVCMYVCILNWILTQTGRERERERVCVCVCVRKGDEVRREEREDITCIHS